MTITTRAISRVAVVVVVAAALAAGSTAAHAHTRTGETTNIASRIIDDALPAGIQVTIHTGGYLVELRNGTESVVTVLGYEGEPYLRVGPRGVEENVRSPAAWLNDTRFGDVAVPPSVDATAEPKWRRVHDEPRWVWHDHRTHWMAPTAPAFVDTPAALNALMRLELVGPVGRAGDAAGPFSSWQLPVAIDGVDAPVTGQLVWVDAPAALPWLLAAAGVIAVAFGLPSRWRDHGLRRAAVVVTAVAAVNAIHLVDDLAAFPADLLDELFGVLHTTLFLTLGLVGGLWARWGTSGPRLALGVGAGALAYHQGIVHLPMLAASQFPTVWPDALVRLTVALGAVQVFAVAIVLWRTRNTPLGKPPAASTDDVACRAIAPAD
ncbi:MAG: hypothetical protein WD377_01870 [Nitriliruptoraceae bacterium]